MNVVLKINVLVGAFKCAGVFEFIFKSGEKKK